MVLCYEVVERRARVVAGAGVVVESLAKAEAELVHSAGCLEFSMELRIVGDHHPSLVSGEVVVGGSVVGQRALEPTGGRRPDSRHHEDRAALVALQRKAGGTFAFWRSDRVLDRHNALAQRHILRWLGGKADYLKA
jgi:hypothetical protein